MSASRKFRVSLRATALRYKAWDAAGARDKGLGKARKEPEVCPEASRVLYICRDPCTSILKIHVRVYIHIYIYIHIYVEVAPNCAVPKRGNHKETRVII